jgi:hypothetical protein
MQKMASRYIPKGAIKVADKNSDAVAYVYTGKDAAGNPAPCARVFWGKQSKPVMAALFGSSKGMTGEQLRTVQIGKYFEARQAWLARKAADRAAMVATGRGVEVGQFLVASWGYDQTNVNFYKVTKLVGKAMAEVVAVPQMDVGGTGGSMSTNVIPAEEPLPGAATYRVLMKAGRATVNGQRAHVWDGKPAYCSWYA